MKKLSLMSLTFALALSMGIILLALRRNWLSTMTAALRHWVHAIPPLSSCPRGTRMFFKGIVCCALVCLVSCKSLNPSLYTLHRDSVAYTLHQSVDTLILRDSVFRHDSIIYCERTIHDTVYITKEIYREALNSKFKIQNSAHSDTVVVTEYQDRVIEHPPEKFIPPFYKRCTIAFWIILAGAILYIIGKCHL